MLTSNDLDLIRNIIQEENADIVLNKEVTKIIRHWLNANSDCAGETGVCNWCLENVNKHGYCISDYCTGFQLRTLLKLVNDGASI